MSSEFHFALPNTPDPDSGSLIAPYQLSFVLQGLGEKQPNIERKPVVQNEFPPTEKDIVKRLAHGFIDILKIVDQKRPQDKGDLLAIGDTRNFHIILYFSQYPFVGNGELSPEEQYVVVDLSPREEIIGTDYMPNQTSSLGILPAFFIGSDGERYQVKNGYKLNPNTGVAQKVEGIWHNGDDYHVDDEIDPLSLPRVDFTMQDREKVGVALREEVDLLPEDFEQLNYLLHCMQTGEIHFY